MSLQKTLKTTLPKKWYKKIEEEGRKWYIECDCGYSKNIWESGGIRYGGTSGTKKERAYCPICKKKRFMKIIKK